ncbi:ATPase, P-type (transporting), HAD superfamily, subfamily IC [Longilinea arvoryzae]|uniref:ATPase, P-type (Transporting), HAD superfamily, subfamily IC n=1 Tax=Longilinea arvoryzae TaxID=360412 RepID=A0A0S7BDW8_9CHLR|nr:HAD-IC family P-type ATPase [Longilinea arvoryzae]GAP12996.1 ATPase, P-type (transporting), HAD superfamily, subfamily IC [Longilinea arvoryzae]
MDALPRDAETSLKNAPLSGLPAAEVLERRRQFGENRLPAEKGVSVWTILLNQVKSPLVYIILTAAGISLLLGEIGDFAIILFVVVVDVIMGFIQEYQAQRTYVALKGLLKPTTTVIRGGQRVEVEVWELVPGDLVVLNAGEKAPGDGELIESTKISIDEAILTGESEPVNKQALRPDEQADSANAPQSRVFMGTTVVTGRGVLRITRTGIKTELGQIAASLSEHAEEDTPLQARLKSFSKILTYIVVGATLVILVVGLMLGHKFFEMLRTSIILAIAAVPEGLLIAVTVILVLGMRKILKRNGLVKRLLAVETLGSVTAICTDKTGTLTEGRMRVNRADLLDEERAWQTMVLCNDLEGPVDIALWEYAEKLNHGGPQNLYDSTQRLGEELFTSETKYMITDVTSTLFHGQHVFFLKGAPEIVLGMCAGSDPEREKILAQADEWAGQGLRLLGLACRTDGILEDYSGYTWLGLLGMEDPIRAGVVNAIQVAEHAGIRVRMITGDYRRTAERIAANTGLIHPGDETLEGAQVAALSDAEFRDQVEKTAVFSRIRPQDKLRIIQALQANGEVTAMIGDGVNDAPALKRANIGVVVGSATDVAKETADLILLDSNFSTIVAAIEEGRVIFSNIRKVVAYTLSNSFAEVLTIFTAMMLQWPAPLAVAQILWIHLICDGPLDIVLSFESREAGIMDEKPRALNAPILTRLSTILIGVISITSSVFALYLFGHFYHIHNNPIEGRSIVFASFAINSIVYIFAYRSMRQPLYRMNPLSTNKPLMWAVLLGFVTIAIAFLFPGLRTLLGIVPLSLQEWGLVIGISLILLVSVEVGKAVSNRLHAHD